MKREESLYNKPIYLTGFSGAGKSSIGKSLAIKMERVFFDLDKEVELLSGKKISKLIFENGEDFFRSIESQILKSLSLTSNSVIALGGGTLLKSENINLIKQTGCLIYLNSEMQNIINNLKGDSQLRPLIANLSIEGISDLFTQREVGYLKADINFEVKSQTIIEASDNLFNRFKLWQQHQTLN